MSLLKVVDKSVTCQRVTSPNVLQYANEKRTKGSFNDVTIEAGSETIAANRMILSCCSRFFEAMFDLEMKEKYQNPVEIHGVDGAAVKSVVDFMYSGEVKIKSENVMELIAASDYLQVDEVKQFCFEFLKSILSLDNWFAILSAAKLYENKDLQNQVYEFSSNSFDDIVRTDEYKSLAESDLVLFISNLYNQTQEESIFNGIVTWCRHDEKSRKIEFPVLFEEFIDLDEISVEFLEKIVLKEELIAENLHCLKVVTNYGFKRLRTFQNCSKIISFGGKKSLQKCVEVYNTSTKSPQKYPDVPMKVFGHCSLRSNNYMYLIGGNRPEEDNKECALQNVWRLCKNDRVLQWKEVAPLNEKCCLMGGTVFRDTLVVAGGHNDCSALTSVQFYQAALDEWKMGSSMQYPRSGCALVSNDQHLFVLGGWMRNKCLSSVERIGNLNGIWKEIEPMQMPRRWFAAVICNGFIYAIGGQTDSKQKVKTNTVEKYDFGKESWVFVSSMTRERSAHAACVMNGKIYVVGGLDAESDKIKTIECFDPSTDTWSIVCETDHEFYHHSLIAL